MGTMSYKIRVPDLLKRLNLRPIDLVRLTTIAVDTAYKAADEKRADEITLDTALKIYNGLKENGYEIDWSDVVEFRKNGQ